jgi:hypothetical protein
MWFIIQRSPYALHIPREKINKETVDSMNLTDMYRMLYPATSENIYFSRTLSRVGHMLSHTTSFKAKNFKIIPRIFPNHKRMKLEVNSRILKIL